MFRHIASRQTRADIESSERAWMHEPISEISADVLGGVQGADEVAGEVGISAWWPSAHTGE
jgi:hypothetical protein